MIRSGSIANALALASLAPFAFAAAPAQAQTAGSGIHAGEIEVPVNKSQVVTADQSISRAMIGNAEIADVLPISSRSIYVLGKAKGTTSLTLYDSANRVIAVMDVSVGPDVEGLQRKLQQLIPDQTIDASLSNGSVVLSGLVNDAGAADRAARIAASFAGDAVINLLSVGGSQQVMLEVRFAEVSRTVGERLGVGGFAANNSGDFAAVVGDGANATGAGELRLNEIVDTFGIFRSIFSLGSLNIEAYLDALERRGLSKTLAEPTLVALSGERASFLAGGEFPIPVIQSGGGGGGGGNNAGSAITIIFKPFGVSLGFTPTVLGDKIINLLVEPEVSSLDASASVTVGGLTVPGLQTRRASTTLELRDGESFAIAGLLQQDFETNVRSLPLLGSLPIIGSLFRSTNFQKGETELLIVVTPRLVQPIKPGQVRLPTDRVADPKPVDVLLDGEGYRPRALPPAGKPTVPPAGATKPAKEPGYEY